MMKWISTSSFVLVTGGISLIVLAVCYEWIDVRKHQNNLKFFTIVGMNSIFIYLFFIFIGDKWLNGYMDVLCGGLLNLAGVPIEVGTTISCLVVLRSSGTCAISCTPRSCFSSFESLALILSPKS